MRLSPQGQRLFDTFPTLGQLDASARQSLLDSAQEMHIASGAVVFEVGQACLHFVFILTGSVRVHLLDPEGHEIVLYRLGPGDTCILTMAALLGRAPYAAYAVTESEVSAASIQVSVFDALMAAHASFRQFVFASHAGRIADLINVVTDVAFTRVGVRLAHCLLRQASPDGAVRLTHEALAMELGSAREVISRNLKVLEQQGYVRRGQGVLFIADRTGLSKLAAGADR